MIPKFKLNDHVKITASGEKGVVIGRAEYIDSYPCCLVRYCAGDGRATESWCIEEALEAA